LQPELPITASPGRALTIAASQAAEETPLELQLFDPLLRDAIPPPAKGSTAATEATSEAGDITGDTTGNTSELDARFADTFDGLNWADIPQYTKPLRTLKGKKSWVFQHGYRVAKLGNPTRTFWICRYCYRHQNRDGMRPIEVTTSTTAAISHMGQARAGHRLDRQGRLASTTLPRGQTSLRLLSNSRVAVSQDIANTLGGFDVQGLRYAAVSWLVDNNHALREFETPAFREMIAYANPEAAEALWVSHRSISAFVMRLYRHLEPLVVADLSQAASKIHISFDGWTTKGGKRGFFGVVAHYADTFGNLRDLPIALPQLTGAHTGERIAEVVYKTLQQFQVDSSKVGYFVLDNAYANDSAIAKLADIYQFDRLHRRLRCAPHTLNLVGQAIMFGVNTQSFNNDTEEHQAETEYLQNWRRDGPLGVLLDIINYIKTPQQHDLFASLQALVNKQSYTQTETILEPIKPVVTRWNSYHDAFERAVHLSQTFNLYSSHHIEQIARDDAYAISKGNKLPEAPSWMRSDGLSAADWAVVTEYIEALRPLKEATKRLEARGKTGGFGALYEVIPVYEYILSTYEAIITTYDSVDYSPNSAPEDHLPINLRAAWRKLNDYYTKLDASPAYYGAVSLHPYYKNYCFNSWRDKPHWLTANEDALQQLWAQYKPLSLPTRRPLPPRSNTIDDAIDALVDREYTTELNISEADELDCWRRYEPAWTKAQFAQEGSPILYWIGLRTRYPHLSQLAIDLLTIPASSCQCERLFSELGDLLEPRRRKIGSQLLAAIQCVRSWKRAGFKPSNNAEDTLNESELAAIYDICNWETDL
jgi:hypothetical protein